MLVALAAPAAPAVSDEGTIQDGNATFTIVVWGDSPSAHFTGVSSNLATDHVFHNGWWFRLEGDDREHAFPVPTTENWGLNGGKRVDLTWDDLDGTGRIRAGETIEVRNTASVTTTPSGYVTRQIAVTNESDAFVAVDLFCYLDLDLLGESSGGDSASFAEYGPTFRLVDIQDAGGAFGAFAGKLTFFQPDALTYRVATYQSNLRTELNDTLIDDFTNTGLPFAAADFTGVLQYSFNLGPGATYVVAAWFSVNVPQNCQNVRGVFCDGFEIGDPALWTEGP